MFPSVTAAWPPFCQNWEGVTYWMYLDTKNKVTTGTGNLIDSVTAAQKLEWVTKEGKLATKQEISDEWWRVKGMTKYSYLNGLNQVWIKNAQLLLTRTTVDTLLLAVTADFWAQLEKTIPKINTFPADAQLSIMDEAWQNGKYYLDPGTDWINTRAAILSEDWTRAANSVPGTGDRAEARKRLFNNAALVKKLQLDPKVLWNTKTPEAPPAPTPPKPVEEEVMHSDKYNVDYISWRGGNFKKITVDKLKAIPTTVVVVQGGLSHASASAQTHAGIGTGDLSVRGMTKDEVWQLCEELWAVDIIPCPRGFVADSFQGKTIGNIHDGNEHIHFLDRDSYSSMHQQAKDQVNEVLAGGDGLLGNAHYTGPSKSYRQAWKTSQYNPANIRNVRGVWYVQSGTLVGNDVNRVTKDNKKKGDKIGFQKQVKRWGRWNAVDSRGIYWAIADSKQTYLSDKDPLAPVKPLTPPKPPVDFKSGVYHTYAPLTNAHVQPTSKSKVSIGVKANTQVQIGSWVGLKDGHRWVKDKVVANRYWNYDVLRFGPPPKK